MMNRFCFFSLAGMLFLSACTSSSSPSAANGTPDLIPIALCGNSLCEVGETNAACPQDCPANTFSGQIEITYLDSQDIGRIAVMVASPQTARYMDGAGVIVVVPPVFSEVGGFMTDPDLTSLGLVQVSFLWPGKTDSASGARSEGEFDYGGPRSAQVLRDVLRYAAARKADIDNHYIVALTYVPPLTEEIGLYAFGDAGLPVINELKLADGQLQNLQYFVGRENPTLDTITCMELGYINDAGQPISNPFYLYPSNFNFDELTLNFANLWWDPSYIDIRSPYVGRAFLDLDGDRTITSGDFIFDGRVPVMSGKRYYSANLTQALMQNNALTLASWPDTLATPQEAARAWQSLQSPGSYVNLRNDEFIKELKVMLVFAQDDHAQVPQDKPHIHQAFQGFRFQAGLWVRLNPDRAYVLEMQEKYQGAEITTTPTVSSASTSGLLFPDNPANTQPTDWLKISEYAYPGQGEAGRYVQLAAVAEMADRTHAGLWDENIGQPFYLYPRPTEEP